MPLEGQNQLGFHTRCSFCRLARAITTALFQISKNYILTSESHQGQHLTILNDYDEGVKEDFNLVN